MIDWFVLLTPLVVLLMILLFAFTGCTNDYEDLQSGPGPELILTLHYDGDFGADVKSIRVSYAVHQDGIPDHSTSAVTFPYDPKGGFWAEVTWEEPNIETAVTCECTVLSDGTEHIPDGSPKIKDKLSDVHGMEFFLTQQGDGYLLA